MAAKNKVNITSDIVAEIRSGNSDTTALGLRTILYEILDSYANVKDGGLLYETAVGYNGLLTLTDPKSFVYKQWVEDYVSSNVGLPFVLANNNKTGENIILSDDSNSVVAILNGEISLSYTGTTITSSLVLNEGFGGLYNSIGGFMTSDYPTTYPNIFQVTTAENIIKHGARNKFSSSENLFDVGGIYFVSNIGIDTTVTAGSDVLNIGATNANVINYGNASTIHNFLGTAIYELQVNSYVTDKLITLNYGGSTSSGIGVGFEIEENNTITGFFKTNAARNGYSMQTPAINHTANLLLDLLTSDKTFSFPDNGGTLAIEPYVDAKVGDIIVDGVTNVAPSQNAVFDALALKADIGLGTTPLEPVISQINTPVGSPATGDRYLVGTAPTGAFVGSSNKIAIWGGASYSYITPITNNTIYVTATLTTLKYDGSGWVAFQGTAILQNGNSLGVSLNIGTNDNFDVNLKRNNVTQWSINSSGWLVRTVGGKSTSLNDGFANFTDSSTAGTPGIQAIQTTTLNRFAQFLRVGSTGVGNFTGTSIASNDCLLVSNGGTSANPYPVFTRGSILYNISGHTATNIGTRLDTVGLRVGALNTLHTSNTNVFDVRGKFHHDTNDNVVVGSAALATTATDGFFYIPTCAGIPTGVPTAKTGRVPMMYDSTNNKFYIYNGAWKSVALI